MAARNCPDRVYAQFDQLLESTRQYDRELGDHVPDPARLDRLIAALTQPLEKPAQPGPGDSQKTGWEDGWTEDDDDEYQGLVALSAAGDLPLSIIDEIEGERVLLRLIEECPACKRWRAGWNWRVARRSNGGSMFVCRECYEEMESE